MLFDGEHMIYTTYLHSPLGKILLAGEGDCLLGLWLEGQKYCGGKYQSMEQGDQPVFIETARWLKRYFAGCRPEPRELRLKPAGTEFQRLIWGLLLEVPYGRTTTYGALAKEAACRLGRASMSAQAVGSAVGHNPISIIIPCHRVLGTDGALTGYAGGIEKKQWLLTHEAAKGRPTPMVQI